MPPALGVGPLGQRPQDLDLSPAVNPVQGQQVGEVPVLEADPAKLQTAHLRVRGADLPARILQRDVLGLAQLAQLRAEQQAQNRRPGIARGLSEIPEQAAARFP